MPQQWMENEWIAQVTPQEEEVQWISSSAQQKLYPRPQPQSKQDSPLKKFVLYIVMTFCCIFPYWLIFGNGIFFLQAITNTVVAAFVLLIFPSVGFFLLIYTGRDQT